MHTFWCKISIKKTLASAQNPENKGSKKFPPPRSMVLNVVKGKIQKTWELAPRATACGSVLEPAGCSSGNGHRPRRNWSDSQLGRPKAAPTVGLSKIGCSSDPDYLLGNLRVSMLSQMRGEGKRKVDGLRKPGSKLGPVAAAFSQSARGRTATRTAPLKPTNKRLKWATDLPARSGGECLGSKLIALQGSHSRIEPRRSRRWFLRCLCH
jgi:hypothetical protein